MLSRSTASLALALFLALPASGEDRGMTLVAGLPEAGEQRLALLIGNAKYETSPLRNPVNDANDMAKTLGDLDFDVILRKNADQREMEDAIREFGRRLKNGGVGLFYYAGHGLQVDGRNYLIPVKAKVVTQKDVKYKAVDLGQLLDEVAAAGNRLNIVILDACRDNPFRGFRSLSRGLAKTDAPTGTIVAYATAPGSVAIDGDGRNGLYTKHLLDSIANPGRPIEQVFKQVRIGVRQETDGVQTPWESSSLTGEFFFKEAEFGTASGTQIAALPGQTPGFEVEDLVAEARRAWKERLERMTTAFDDAKSYDSRKAPPDLKRQVWKRFLDAFPDDDPYSSEDEKMRKHAEGRIAHWRAAPERDTTGFDVDDLVEEAREAAGQQLSWMRKAFQEAEAYETRDVGEALKEKAWRRFLESFPDDDPYSSEDDTMRRKAEARAAHWKSATGSGSAANPFQMDDLVEEEKRMWAAKLVDMKKAFASAGTYEKGDAPNEMKVEVWKRFLEAFPQGNPYSAEDDSLRRQANNQLAHWRAQPASAKKFETPPPGAGGDPEQAARQALAEYRAAYESGDFERLSRVWVMNPDQREAMQSLFDCADQISLVVEERGITTAPGMVSIEFSQSLDFSGPKCMTKSGTQVSAMTATVIQSAGNRWMISSILPTRNR